MVSIPAAHPVALNLISQKDYATRLVTTFGCCYLVIHLVISLVAKNISYRREKKATILYSCNTFSYQKNLVKQTLLENFNPEPFISNLSPDTVPIYQCACVLHTDISRQKDNKNIREGEHLLLHRKVTPLTGPI